MLHNITPAVNPLTIEAQRINEDTRQPNIDFISPLAAGLKTGRAITGEIESIDETRKATEFEQLLQSGEQGMKAALEDAKQSGVNVNDMPETGLYLNNKEDVASWYGLLSEKIQTKQKLDARKENFANVSSEDPEQNIKGIEGFVQSGEADPLQSAEAVKGIRSESEFLKLLDEDKITSTEDENAPEDAVKVDISKFAPTSENIDKKLKGIGASNLPEAVKVAAENVAKKLNLPTDLLVAIAARENKGFAISDKNPESSATGLGQLTKATGQKMLGIAKEQGLIGKDVSYESAVVDPEMNLLMTGLLFKDNMKLSGGNPKQALLLHRLGPKNLAKFNKGEKILVTFFDKKTQKNSKDPSTGKDLTKDITADAKNWIDQVMSVAFGDAVPGGSIEESFDNSEEGLLERINTIDENISTISEKFDKFSNDPRIKELVSNQENTRKSLTERLKLKIREREGRDKSKAAKAKATEKGKAANRKVSTSLKTLIAMAEVAGPDGLFKGIAKSGANLITGGGAFPDKQAYEGFKKALAGNLAKGIGGESGRLTDQDIIRALAMLPDTSSSPKLFGIKLDYMKILSRVIQDDSLTQEQRDEKLVDAIYRSAGKIALESGKPFYTEEQFLEEYKKDPSDFVIRKFLLASGREIDDDSIRAVKANLSSVNGESASPENVAPKQPISLPGITIQNADNASQIISPIRDNVSQ